MRRDPGAIETLLRLRRWTRPHRRTIAFMIVTACGAMLAQALVPLVAGRIVDGPIAEHDTAGIWPLAGVALIFGIAEAVLFFARGSWWARHRRSPSQTCSVRTSAHPFGGTAP